MMSVSRGRTSSSPLGSDRSLLGEEAVTAKNPQENVHIDDQEEGSSTKSYPSEDLMHQMPIDPNPSDDKEAEDDVEHDICVAHDAREQLQLAS